MHTYKINIQLILIVVFSLGFSPSVYAQELSGKSQPLKVDFTVGSRAINNTQPIVEVVKETPDDIVNKELGTINRPVYHALIIGVSDYQYAGANLPNLDKPVKDANELYNVLTAKYSFDPENVTLLENPDRAKLIDTFYEISNTVTERDNLLIFYAGHGFYDKDKDFGFWLPSDSKSTSRANWIANSTIKDYISAIPSKHTLLVTDACFGGSIFKTRAVTGMNLLKINELYRDKSRKAITSGSLTEVPDESFFVYMLIKTLQDNEYKFLPASSIFTRIYEPVMNNSPSVPQFGVIQGAGDEGGDFIFIKRE
jgi:hypothetical protein